MVSDKDLERLDDYIANRLTAKERVDFEQKLASDPVLQSELAMQQRIADAIRHARRTELKAMLNSIPVTAIHTSGSATSVAKIMSAIVIAGLTATGIYYYYQRSQPAANHDTMVPLAEESSPVNTADSSSSTKEPVVIGTQPSAEVPRSNEQQPTSVPSAHKASESNAVSKPKLDVFDPAAEQEEEAARSSAARPAENPEPASASTIEVQTEKNHKRYTFHYQFREEKLYLYGNFEQNLYEIMEFFDENKRTVFLYYKNSYYLLKDDNDKIKPLTPITDAQLLRKLKAYRNK
jgi:hypothetical protein